MAEKKQIKKPDKREKYHDKMIRLGFIKIHPYVHQDDKETVLNYVEKKRKDREKQLE